MAELINQPSDKVYYGIIQTRWYTGKRLSELLDAYVGHGNYVRANTSHGPGKVGLYLKGAESAAKLRLLFPETDYTHDKRWTRNVIWSSVAGTRFDPVNEETIELLVHYGDFSKDRPERYDPYESEFGDWRHTQVRSWMLMLFGRGVRVSKGLNKTWHCVVPRNDEAVKSLLTKRPWIARFEVLSITSREGTYRPKLGARIA